MTTSLGLIETIGLPAAITALDAAVKSANVRVIDYELTRGSGLVTIKFEGDVAAVKAAVDAGAKAAEQIGKVYTKLVIPRPNEQVQSLIKRDKLTQAKDEDENLEITEEKVTDVQIDKEEEAFFPKEEDSDEPDDVDDGETCNLCHDPACPRRKGDLRTLCIHYNE